MSPESTLDVLRERSHLSPLVLDRSHSHGTADHLHGGGGGNSSSSNLHKREKIILEMGDFHHEPVIDYPTRLPMSGSILGHRHLLQSSDSIMQPGGAPHHITSIHSGKFVASPASTLRSRKKLRNFSEDLCTRMQLEEHEWDSSDAPPLEKKPLGEFLNEIKVDADHNSDAMQVVDDANATMTYQDSSKERSRSNGSAYAKESFSESAKPKGSSNRESQNCLPNQPHIKIMTKNGVEYKDVSGCLSCDTCFPGGKLTVVPLMDSRDYTEIPPKERDYTGSTAHAKSSKAGSHSFISWFRTKKKSQVKKREVLAINQKNTIPTTSTHLALPPKPNSTKLEVENAPEGKSKDMQFSMESMKQEVSLANKKRDDALAEVFELKKAIQDMGKKLGHLENQYKSFDSPSKRIGNLSLTNGHRGDLDAQRDKEDVYEQPRISSSWGPIMPTGPGPTKREFCHAVVEARVGVKQFCRTLLQQLREKSALDKIDTMLKAQNFKVSVSVKGGTVSKRVKYLIESLVNEAFYEDFENIKFTKSGSYCVLDPRQRPLAFFKTYLGISQVGWSELVNKESSAYSESFDGFCDQKMNKMVEELLFFWDLEGGWPDELVEAFFVAAKWVWLLHLLAFSFEHPATIFRVSNESHFDPLYMEELPSKDRPGNDASRLKLSSQHFGNGRSSEHDSPNILAMVMPGFFFNSYEVIRCKVLLSNATR